MSKTTKILNGILCVHDLPVEMLESNDGVLFLHNERDALGKLVKDFSNYGKVSLSTISCRTNSAPRRSASKC